MNGYDFGLQDSLSSSGCINFNSFVCFLTVTKNRSIYLMIGSIAVNHSLKNQYRWKRFAVLWAIWLHRNEVMFEGKAVSSEGVIQEVERLVGLWFVNV